MYVLYKLIIVVYTSKASSLSFGGVTAHLQYTFIIDVLAVKKLKLGQTILKLRGFQSPGLTPLDCQLKSIYYLIRKCPAGSLANDYKRRSCTSIQSRSF